MTKRTNSLLFALVVLGSLFLLWFYGTKKPFVAQQAEIIWVPSDYQLFFKPNAILNAVKKEKQLSNYDFSSFFFTFKLLQNNGVALDKAWRLFAKINKREIYLTCPLADTLLFDNGILPFLSDSISQKKWCKIKNTAFQVKRVGQTAIVFFGHNTTPSNNLLAQTKQIEKSALVNQKFLAKNDCLMALKMSEKYLKTKKLNAFLLTLDKQQRLNLKLQLIAKNVHLPSLKDTAWKSIEKLDTNYCAMSFDPKAMNQFVQSFTAELTWINPMMSQKINSFLNAWNGDLYVLLGGNRTTTKLELVTNIDENFNLTEEKIIHEITYQNNILAVSYNKHWSSFENEITSKPKQVKSKQNTVASSKNSVSANLPKIKVRSNLKPTTQQPSLSKMNLSKENGFVILHGAPKCPKLIPTPAHTSLFLSPFKIKINKATSHEWIIDVNLNSKK